MIKKIHLNDEVENPLVIHDYTNGKYIERCFYERS
jgi:hypothetical protein